MAFRSWLKRRSAPPHHVLWLPVVRGGSNPHDLCGDLERPVYRGRADRNATSRVPPSSRSDSTSLGGRCRSDPRKRCSPSTLRPHPARWPPRSAMSPRPATSARRLVAPWFGGSIQCGRDERPSGRSAVDVVGRRARLARLSARHTARHGLRRRERAGERSPAPSALPGESRLNGACVDQRPPRGYGRHQEDRGSSARSVRHTGSPCRLDRGHADAAVRQRSVAGRANQPIERTTIDEVR
jgi:hypothetical protein